MVWHISGFGDLNVMDRRPKRGWLYGIAALPCQACGVGWMYRTTFSTGNALGVAVGLLIVGIGVIVWVALPGIGCWIAPLICLVGLLCGGSTHKVWKCDKCGATITRA